MPGRERWLVDRDGFIRVQAVDTWPGRVLPSCIVEGDRIYDFSDCNDDVEIYEERQEEQD